MKVDKIGRIAGIERDHHKITFSNLFKTCTNGVFSDYKISLTSKIPLVMQVLGGGSLLYEVFAADWIMHALAGFGVGAIALKAYTVGVNHHGYGCLVSYFRLDRFRAFRVERKTGSAGFTLFSLIVVALAWELFEVIVSLAAPGNIFRIRPEPLWNIIGDIAFAVTGGMAAWYLIKCKLKWL